MRTSARLVSFRRRVMVFVDESGAGDIDHFHFRQSAVHNIVARLLAVHRADGFAGQIFREQFYLHILPAPQNLPPYKWPR